MTEIAHFLIEHGYVVLAIWVVLDQTGIPMPALPGLLTAGALAGTGQLDLVVVLGVATLACLPSDLVWYEVGRRRGGSMLGVLCRLSLEPESCVRATENMFARFGPRVLLVGKFVPGLQTAAPSLSGVLRMPRGRFFLFDAAGALLWAGTFVLLGYAFHDQLERLLPVAARLGGWVVVVVVAPLGIYLAFKFIQRWRFLRSVRGARITPEELKRRLAAGEDLQIIDLRHTLDFDSYPHTIPGATWVPLEEIDRRLPQFQPEREVVLYCR